MDEQQIVTVKTDDPRIGHYNEDGSFKAWPATTWHGDTYMRVDSTVRNLDGAHFVVFATMRDDPNLKIVVKS